MVDTFLGFDERKKCIENIIGCVFCRLIVVVVVVAAVAGLAGLVT
jgi:hypothetical protein